MSQSSFSLTLLLFIIGGCSKSSLELVKVSGTVKYSNGTVPEAETRVLRLEPVPDAAGHLAPRAATADVRPDGIFDAMTLRPGDGAMAGDYKPVLLFWKSPLTRESVLPRAYGNVKTTPLQTISVKPGQQNHFEFVIESSQKP